MFLVEKERVMPEMERLNFDSTKKLKYLEIFLKFVRANSHLVTATSSCNQKKKWGGKLVVGHSMSRMTKKIKKKSKISGGTFHVENVTNIHSLSH
jgi:hypothetical protein